MKMKMKMKRVAARGGVLSNNARNRLEDSRATIHEKKAAIFHPVVLTLGSIWQSDLPNPVPTDLSPT
jgi:hypothetical protein